MDLMRTPRGYLSTLGHTARIEEITTALRHGQGGVLFATDTNTFALNDTVLRRLGALMHEETVNLENHGFLLLAGGPGQTVQVEGDDSVTVWQYVTTTTGTALLDLLNDQR